MNKTILIVGAGPAIGMSLARRFGREGYKVGLISRSQQKLDGYVAELAGLGIEAYATPADVLDRPALDDAISRVRAAVGPIGVMEYSPLLDMYGLIDVLKLDVEHAQSQLEMQILGAITSVRAVLDDLLASGDGALLFTLGSTAYMPGPSHANGSVAVAGLRQYALNLYMALKPKGIYVGTLAIGRPPQSDEIADIYWEKVQKRESCETLYGDPRLHAAYEVLIAQGLARVYPPALTGELPTPRDDAERNLHLVCLHHLRHCIEVMGGTPEEAQRMTDLARARGGDISAPHFGGNIDRVFPAPSTI